MKSSYIESICRLKSNGLKIVLNAASLTCWYIKKFASYKIINVETKGIHLSQGLLLHFNNNCKADF